MHHTPTHTRKQVERWYGEPVRALLLPTSLFITNRKGYPTLSRRHQAVATAFMRLSVQVRTGRSVPMCQSSEPGIWAASGA